MKNTQQEKLLFDTSKCKSKDISDGRKGWLAFREILRQQVSKEKRR